MNRSLTRMASFPTVLSIHRLSHRPDHWKNSKPVSFENPWDSWREAGPLELATVHIHSSRLPSLLVLRSPPLFFTQMAVGQTKASALPSPEQINQIFPIHVPDFGASFHANPDDIKATWLGHACFLVEFPKEAGQERGIRVLFDPVFSNRCSPFSWIGPARYTRKRACLTCPFFGGPSNSTLSRSFDRQRLLAK